MRIQALLLALAVPSLARAQASEMALYEQIQIHRANVARLADAYVAERPDAFRSLDRATVSAYFRFHDGPKIYGQVTLRGLGYLDERTIFARLYGFFGLSANELSEDRRRELWSLVQDLNRLEAQEKERDFFGPLRARIGRSGADRIQRELEDLEVAADVTDTRMNPQRRLELRIPHGAPGPAEYLRAAGRSERVVQAAAWLEANYGRIVRAEGVIELTYDLGLEVRPWTGSFDGSRPTLCPAFFSSAPARADVDAH